MSNTIVFDPPEWSDAELIGETVLGGAPDAAAGDADRARSGLGRRASIGRPQLRPLRADDAALDEPTREFIAATEGQFHLVNFQCSLEPGEGEELEGAALMVELSDNAVSWSMAPLRLSTKRGGPAVSLETTVSLTPFLQINGTWAPEADQQVCWLLALGVGESDPEWRMRATKDQSINGPHSFTMVVHSPGGTATNGQLRLTARFHANGFRFRYRAQIREAEHAFVLGG